MWGTVTAWASGPRCTRAASRRGVSRLWVRMNRNGLVVDVVLSQATGTAETEAALTMLERAPRRGGSPSGADKGYDTREFATTCRSFEITPAVAVSLSVTVPLERRARGRGTPLREASQSFRAQWLLSGRYTSYDLGPYRWSE